MIPRETSTTALNKTGRLRLWIVFIAFLAYMVAFFDRSNVSILIANPNFTNAFGITANKSTQGLLLTAFLLFYGITCFFAGPIVHRFGARKALGYGLLSWAIFMAVMGSISTVAILLACRALLGIGEAVLGPSVSKLVQTWFPVQERAKVNGTWFIGLLIAQIVAPPLITGLVTSLGWRASFYFLALIGLVPVVVAFLFVYDSPSKHPRISREESEYISGGRVENVADSGKPAGGFGFLKESNFWLVTIIYAIVNAVSWGMMGWMPTYYKATLGFSFARMGLIAALPYLVGAASVILFTPLMDKYNSRAPFTVIGCLGFGVCLFAAMNISHQAPAVAVFCVANAFFMPVIPSLFTILQNTIRPIEIANATGFFNGISYSFASAFPFLMGALYTSTGNLKNGFYLLVCMTVLAIIMGIPLMRHRL
jgi:sugar phosphate permease